MSDFLTRNLSLAIGRGALAKHQESCAVCSDDYDCEVAQAHKRTIADLTSRPGATS